MADTAPLAVVLRDVAATYPLPVRVDRDGDIDWITVAGGDGRAGVRSDEALPPAERLAAVADQVADWLVEALPGAGRPAVWPGCPRHPGTHPLRPQMAGGEAVWACPAGGDVVAAIGSLGG
ncbi:hypothetical protein [Symbioplanes lichenis]|uniref:hypothetical protein n=1 Tax=Symbioplanes lichenis TaxID=1629072 RepID=UPI002738209B|nr:hypothetical protein [Actinoplanes lichenis]